MKKVAIFGNAGGGKSALAKKLAEVTQHTPSCCGAMHGFGGAT